jgi:hypothetical protein
MKLILKKVLTFLISTALSAYISVISLGEKYVQTTTVAAQTKWLDETHPKPSRQLTTFADRMSVPLTVVNTLHPIWQWYEWSAGSIFLVYNILTKWAVLLFVATMSPLWSIVKIPMDIHVQKGRLVVEFERVEDCSPYAQLRGEDDVHLSLLSSALIGTDPISTDVLESDEPFNRYRHIVTCTLVGLHFHRHLIADTIFCMVQNTEHTGSVFARCITIFCFNMGLNHYANAYVIFSEDIHTAATHWELVDFSRRLKRHWNSPVTMFVRTEDDQSIYQTIIQSLYDAVEAYAKANFDIIDLEEIEDIFGNTSTSELFAHLVCMVYDHSVTHQMYHTTGLSAFRTGVKDSIVGDPEIAQKIGLLVNKTTCTIESNLCLLPNSTELIQQVQNLDAWIVEKRPDAPWLRILSAAGSISN